MIIDGKTIAKRIYKQIHNEITHMEGKPHLTVFTCAPNFETQKYLALKRKKAHEAGIAVNLIEFGDDITTDEIVTSVRHACMQTDGIIVQLPFPSHIAIEKVLSSIPAEYDVDVANYTGTIHDVLPPVVGAIAEIAQEHCVSFLGKKVVVVGKGRLVGAPAALWAASLGATVVMLDRDSIDSKEHIREADILILGAGSPALITKDMIRPGVALFDAGTSEEGGILKGDADPTCAEVASLFTPVPGGIGPITVAVLLRNLILLKHRQ
jgi:methylenetetrahydrofolate dehydrogenase (NADP+) / methenyltetrahydrofolate cyclohydrolase